MVGGSAVAFFGHPRYTFGTPMQIAHRLKMSHKPDKNAYRV
jgi:hypothetical protein